MSIVKLKNISKSYTHGDITHRIISELDLNIARGEFVALLGKSGSGKSSLLNIVGMLDDYDSGSYFFNGQLVCNNERFHTRLRNQYIGFVFQSYNLIASKTILENISLPLYYRGINYKDRMHKAYATLELFGLQSKAGCYPSQLSGGECQRVAIARAMVGDPTIILADEPTGALDATTGEEVMSIFEELNSKGITIIVVTHDEYIASYAGTVYYMKDGELLNKTVQHDLVF